MAIPSTRPDLLLLWKYIDGDIGSAEAQEIEAYLATNLEGYVQLERLRQFTADVRAVLAESAFFPSPSSASSPCPSPESVMAYAAQAMPVAEKGNFEQHLRGCDTCLRDIIEYRLINQTLTAAQKIPLPQALKAQAETLWVPPQPALTRLVIQRVQQGVERGLALVEKYIVDPVISVLEMPTPQLALRGEAKVLVFRLEAGKLALEGTVMAPPDDEPTLTLKFFDADQKPLPRTMVEIRQQGKLIFSAETDARGELAIVDIALEPGIYEIACPALQTRFEIELRPPQE